MTGYFLAWKEGQGVAALFPDNQEDAARAWMDKRYGWGEGCLTCCVGHNSALRAAEILGIRVVSPSEEAPPPIGEREPEKCVYCRVCGRELQLIATSGHLRSHAMTREEYQRLYPDAPLVSEAYRRKFQGKEN